MRLVYLLIIVLFAIVGMAQDDVHITPRISPPKEEPAKADYRVKVDVALIPVIVTNERTGGPFPGLVKGHFKLKYNGKEQVIKYFSEDDAPVSLIIVMDRSGSMGLKVDTAKAILKAFQQESNPRDEIALITFADTIDFTDFTSVMEELDDRTLLLGSNGRTTLWDAIYLAVDRMKTAKYPRRAIVVMTDGGDNHSRYTFREIKNLVQETDDELFFIDLLDKRCEAPPDRNPCEQEVQDGPYNLGSLMTASGGYGYVIEDVTDAKAAATNIGIILRQEYVLGFNPKLTQNPDGKYHRVKVELQHLPKGVPPLRVNARDGLYAPVQ